MSNTAINHGKGNTPKTDFCPMFKKSSVDRSSTKGRLIWRVETLGWGAALLWIGAVLLTETSLGLALAGLAAITLGGQMLRFVFALGVEGFWVAVGSLFLLAGAWELFAITLPLIPVLIAVGGVALVIWALIGRNANPM